MSASRVVSAATAGSVVIAVLLVSQCNGDGSDGSGRRTPLPHGPSEATAADDERTVKAVPYSHCVSKRGTRSAGACYESKGLEEDGPAVHVNTGDSVRIRLGARARKLRAWSGVRTDGRNPFVRELKALAVKRAGRRGRRWVVTIRYDGPEGRGVLEFEPKYRRFESDVAFAVRLLPR